MKRFFSLLFAVVAGMSLHVPAVAVGSGGGGQSCYVCEGWYNREHQTAVVACLQPESGSSGNSKCEVVCSDRADGVGGCSCITDGDWCYYIVVNG